MTEDFTPRLETMFPNCNKYKKCCTKDREFWKKMKGQSMPKVPSSDIPVKIISHEQILHNVNGFKIDPKRDKIYEMPEGFEGW